MEIVEYSNISIFNEDAFEQGIIDHLCSAHGYEHLYGPDVPRSSDAFDDAFLPDIIGPALEQINPNVNRRALDLAIAKIKEIEGGTLVAKNKAFTDMLQGGVEVRWFDGKEDRNDIVRLVDFDNPDRNDFHVVNQWTFIERGTNKRPDVIVFVNGLPLVLFELKSPARAEADNEDAYQQIQNYKHQIPTLFVYNAFCVISDMLHTKVGTITANESRFVSWKSTDGSYEATQFADWKTPLDGMFPKARLISLLKNFVLFSEDIKILAGYHQYFAVNKALESVHEAIGGDGKGGVFWHTQGSGKSLSMVFLAHLLEEKLNSPTIVVITDRNDLDSQLFAQFSKCADFLRQTPVQAQSRAEPILLNRFQAAAPTASSSPQCRSSKKRRLHFPSAKTLSSWSTRRTVGNTALRRSSTGRARSTQAPRCSSAVLYRTRRLSASPARPFLPKTAQLARFLATTSTFTT